MSNNCVLAFQQAGSVVNFITGKIQSTYAEGKALCLSTTTGYMALLASPAQPHLHPSSSLNTPASSLQPLWKTLPFAKPASFNQGSHIDVASSVVPAQIALSKTVKLFPHQPVTLQHLSLL